MRPNKWVRECMLVNIRGKIPIDFTAHDMSDEIKLLARGKVWSFSSRKKLKVEKLDKEKTLT